MTKSLLLPILLIGGAGVGSGAAYATSQLFGTGAEQRHELSVTAFVPARDVLAPLVSKDGRLIGYASFNLRLEVDTSQADMVQARMPMLLHAINLRTYRKPMASGPDGLLPDLALFAAIVDEAAAEAFGANVVRKVAITKATPA